MTPDIDNEPDSSPEPDPARSQNHPSPPSFPLQVDQFFASIIRHAPSAEAGLGGRLLYAGVIDNHSRALMVAANIAGAASLAVSADPAAQKQTIRDGVADFLVTNLDEALRILKNEIRKREPVAVCVAAARASIEQEMLERGVMPDLVLDSGSVETLNRAVTFGGGPQFIVPVAPAEYEVLLSWSVDEAPAKWLPRLDAIAIECLASDGSFSGDTARRWLRMAPRYLGRLAGNTRILRCPRLSANEIANRMRASAESGEISVPVRIELL
jgi:hypothetical protein